MVDSIIDKVKVKYSAVGNFDQIREADNYVVFGNRFSRHYIFSVGTLDKAEERIQTFQNIVEKDYLGASDSVADLDWNYYAVFIIDCSDTSEYNKLKEIIESDLRLFRRYVLTQNDIDTLPPFYIALAGRKTEEKETLWEQEWRETIGDKLYDQMMERPKSHLESLFREYINDKVNSLK